MEIPHSKPWLTYDEVNAVINVLKSGYISTGRQCAQLEKELSNTFNKRCLLVSSGTAALHLALLAGDIKKDDPVAIPTHTCPSVLYALNYIGAKPILFDCGPLGYGIEKHSFLQAVSQAKAVVVVHTYGLPVDFKGIVGSKNLWIIEDCAQSFGTKSFGKFTGTEGNIGVFSFYPTKLIAGGELGALIACDEIIRKIKRLRSPHFADDKITRFPYTPSDVFAAIVRTQIKKLDMILASRKKIAEKYNMAFNGKDNILLPQQKSDYPVAWYRYVIGIPVRRELVIKKSKELGIYLGYGVKTPLHRLMEKDSSAFPNSEFAFKYSVSLPIYPGLTDEQVNRVVNVVFNTLDSSV